MGELERVVIVIVALLCLNFIELGCVRAQDGDEDAENFDVETLYRTGYDPMRSRVAPKAIPARQVAGNVNRYIITNERLNEIRAELLYPFFDTDQYRGHGDLQTDINSNNAQLHKNLGFLLPFFGFGFNYTVISLHGHVSFSDSMDYFPAPPLKFPNTNWPKENDPSFIAPFYSRCKIGTVKEGENDLRKSGVYFRMERDLPGRYDQFGVELRERLKWDIRESMIGAESYIPKHTIIVTWKNVTFAGGLPQAITTTNTFQAIITTDEVRTFAMFNYAHLGWTTHTEAGGDTLTGQGGVPAFVGFNAGNGTRAFQYNPYSQDMRIRDLPWKGWANDKPGRHVFRIDEKVYSGNCFDDESVYKSAPLVFAPESGNMMGGIMVNVTGPCFSPDRRIMCRFDTQEVVGKYVGPNRAVCVMPRVFAAGYIDLAISIDGGQYAWKGRFYVETPVLAPEMVWFHEPTFHDLSPETLRIRWDKYNLTMDESAKVSISLWGYKETTLNPELVYIDLLTSDGGVNNNGDLTIDVTSFRGKNSGRYLRSFEVGFLRINLTTPVNPLQISPILWSRPIPLGWYFSDQWKRYDGADWAAKKCEAWYTKDRKMRYFANEIPMCPCLLEQAIGDKGRYLPDFECDKEGNAACFYHRGASMCYRTGTSNIDGAGQQCCYDIEGKLMMTADNKWGGNPMRVHNLGLVPWNEQSKVPSLSHWYHDKIPFYTCCLWQGDSSDGCDIYRFERRASQDCVGYQPPGAAAVFGDPHFYTFDNLTYTFNGKGEFVLVRANDNRHKLDVQARFEAIENNMYGTARGTVLTAVAAKENSSVPVEVRIRAPYAQWRYRLDVFVDYQPVYFDSHNRRVQNFKGVTVYTPANILNQSHVIIMFASGAGVEVVENLRHMTARVYLPISYVNHTRGLFGNWSFEHADDLMLPDGTVGPTTDVNNLQVIHDHFGMKWSVDDKVHQDKGRSLFYHENDRSSNFYYDPTFRPVFDLRPALPINITSFNSTDVDQACGTSYQCFYDYAVTLNKQYGTYAKYYFDDIVNIRSKNLRSVISCGALPVPQHGRKSSFEFTVGTIVKIDCDPGYVLVGEDRRYCWPNGEWSWTSFGQAQCIPQDVFDAQQGGAIFGYVMAAIIPILCCLICFCCYRRRSNDTGKASWTTVKQPSQKTFPVTRTDDKPIAPKVERITNVTKSGYLERTSESDSGRGSNNGSKKPSPSSDIADTKYTKNSVTDSSWDSSDKESPVPPNDFPSLPPKQGKRRYDGVYYTHEPLQNRPNVSFNKDVLDLDMPVKPEVSKSVAV